MSTEADTTFERLRQILAKEFEIAPELIHPTARMDELAIDSLAVIEVIFRLEDEFNISFPQAPGELRTELRTVGDLAACVERLAAEQQARTSSGAAAP